jgi:transposase
MDATTPGPDTPLPTDVTTLQTMVHQLRGRVAELDATVADLRARLDALQAKLDSALSVAFGRRSERARRPRRVGGDEGPRPKRHEHGRSLLPEHLERRIVTHDLTDAEKVCPCCGTPRTCIGEQTAEQLDCDPIPFFVLRTVRRTYACRRCDPTAVPPEDRIHTAGLGAVGPIPKGLCGPGLLAHVLTAKFADHIPLHRLVGVIARGGVAVAESTLGDWVRQSADLLKPLHGLMHRRLLLSRVIWTDDTRSRYAVPGRDTMPSGHFWVAIGDAAAPFTVFDFTTGYSADGPGRFFAGFRGYLQADCLQQYETLFATTGIRHVACWAHARRKFLDAGEVAKPAVEFIRRLYQIERAMPPPDTPEHVDRRKAIRRAESVPILEALKGWLDTESSTALPRSSLGTAIAYVRNHWPAFVRYTEEGYLSIDNNRSERALRSIAVGRNNWKFVGAASAGERAAIHYTIIGTCRHLGLDPFAYLRDVLPALHALGDTPMPEQLGRLLPDAWASRRPPAHPPAEPPARVWTGNDPG